MSRINNTGKLYKIICSTDAYHAARNPRFARNETSYVVDAGLTLQEARTKLLAMFSEVAGRQVRNWGQAVNIHYADGLDAYATFKDGTRSYSYDVYTYDVIAE